ncbi:MAG: hypothetical protein AAGA60_31500 [Cyanobacteria bacterium P01_E01_bin.42]
MSSFERRYLVIAIASLILQIVSLATEFTQPRETILATPAVIQVDK